MQKQIMRAARWMEKNEFIILTLLLTIFLRIPTVFEPYWYGDEGIYLTIGQSLRRGDLLYRDVVDHKTPLIYWLAALAPSLPKFKIVLLFASLISIFLFHRISLLWLGKGWSHKISTLLFTLGTTLPALEGNIVNAELIMMPWVLLGMLLSHRLLIGREHAVTDRKLPLVIGSLMGMAILTKVPAVFDLAALCLSLILIKKERLSVILILAGVSIMVLLSVLWFTLQGTLPDYLRFGLLYNITYVQEWESPFSQPLLQFLSSLPVRGFLLLLLVGFVSYQKKKLSVYAQFGLIWLGFTLFGALFSLRPYPHYFLQTVPAVALLVGLWWKANRHTRFTIGGVIAGGIVIFYGFGLKPYPTFDYYSTFIGYIRGEISQEDYFRSFDTLVPWRYELAKWLTLRTDPDERIYIWGDDSLVYALSRRGSTSKYLASFHVQSMNGQDETLTELQNDKPRYIADLMQNPDDFPELYSFIKQNYILSDAQGKAMLYRLKLQ
jgi:hypothetical protein